VLTLVAVDEAVHPFTVVLSQLADQAQFELVVFL
jgi:hypothetical protein